MLVSRSGPTMLARIAVMKALNRHVVRGFWIDAQVIRGGDQMAGTIAKQRQQQGTLPEGNIRSIKRCR